MMMIMMMMMRVHTHTHTQQSDVRINGKLIFSSEENESGTQVRREKTEGKEQVFY